MQALRYAWVTAAGYFCAGCFGVPQRQAQSIEDGRPTQSIGTSVTRFSFRTLGVRMQCVTLCVTHPRCAFKP
ncbi:hypothetical protein AO070_02550 [Pseudomonas syringae pv. syringae PD2766]|nr:hypothetical protein AO070_02550 [Pseudomonas syringae pv. syringae PD2766]